MPISPGGIFTPDDNDDWDLTVDLAAMGISIDGAIDNGLLNTSFPVDNATERDSRFPSPRQGNRVFRLDTGWEETYYGAYNAATNPGGAVAAGWYPTGGRMPVFKAIGTANQTLANSWVAAAVSTSNGYQFGGFSDGGAPAYEIYLPYAGLWDFSATVDFASGTAGDLRALRIVADGSSTTDYPVRRVLTASGSYTAYETFMPIYAATRVSLQANHAGVSLGSSRRTLFGRYLGPTPAIAN